MLPASFVKTKKELHHEKTLFTFISTLILAVTVTASCFANDLENIKFKDSLDSINSLPNTTTVAIGSQQYAYHTVVQFNPQETFLDNEVHGIEYDFFKERLYEVKFVFKNSGFANFLNLGEILNKRYGKPYVLDLSGSTFAAVSYNYTYKDNNYDLAYYCNKVKKITTLTLVVKTNYMAPDENCLGFRNYKPKQYKTLDDLTIFK